MFDLSKIFYLSKISLFPKWKNRLNNVWFKQDFWFKQEIRSSQCNTLLKSKNYCITFPAVSVKRANQCNPLFSKKYWVGNSWLCPLASTDPEKIRASCVVPLVNTVKNPQKRLEYKVRVNIACYTKYFIPENCFQL